MKSWRRVAAIGMLALGLSGLAVPGFALINPLGWPTTYATYVQIYSDTDYLAYSGDYWYYHGTLQGGVTYKFVLVVPFGCDFDIKIFDENGNLVASGTRSGSQDEVVYITPLWTGPFTIKVYSYSGSGWYTLRVYR